MKKKPTNGRGPDPAPPQHRARGIAKAAEYVGSFMVEDLDLQQQAGWLEEQLQKLKDCPRRRSVVLRFSLQGLKVYDADGEVGVLWVQTLHLLLCRSFQLCYLLAHPEQQEGEGDPPGTGVLREPLNPDQVSRNVNALVSFRRLPAPAGLGTLSPGHNFPPHSFSTLQERRAEMEGRAWRPGNPYCSPVLVRKKAIRSKVLRSGAYRDCGGEGQLHQPPRDTAGWESRGPRSLAFLPENESILAESVWAFTGITRAGGVALLRGDIPGSFLLRPEPGLAKRWCLWVRAPCGVVPYGLVRTHQGRFCLEVTGIFEYGCSQQTECICMSVHRHTRVHKYP
ncbi:PREDICTED: SH2 domain-containing protein 5 [Chaetura pelagica]|uniref:SH2 domain-containing protein 5 n=1 Tax=Chaetura pelagica TaxID=8897 RepID=UPI0005239FEF|nr:PREDICTED: SH2 domain-containing protein 5 [Chaetura pelagica]